jgi:hypothetical protein
MQRIRPVGRWLALAIFLWLALSFGCTGNQEPRSTVAEQPKSPVEATLAPGKATSKDTVTQSLNLTQAPSAVAQTKTPPAAAPVASPTPPAAQAESVAERSDFIVPLLAATSTASLTLTPTLAVTPSISVASAASGSLQQKEEQSNECAFDAQFIADVSIPDDTILEPESAFVKTWRVRNSGTCAWRGGLELRFISGDRMDGPASVVVSPTLVGETVDISVPFSAPRNAGAYTSNWQLNTAEEQTFGDPLYVQVVVEPTATGAPTAAPQPRSSGSPVSPLVLLNYFAWYDAGGWDDCNISGGDKPLQLYGSDDPTAIGRHVRMALDAGADGFTQQWFVPGGRTDRNFETLLAQSSGTGFRSTVVFLRHIWHGSPAPNQANVAEAIRYVLDKYSHHPNFLNLEDKPVLFFTDVYRVPTAPGQTAQAAWASIRAQVDPAGNAWWIAEGLDPSYLSVFDGLWVYKITHATYPQAYLKAGQWATSVRAWETRTGRRKLWIATLSPGWDDTRAGCKADVRVPSAAHKQERGEGAFYRATLDAALASQPDWLWINSLNEWVEGTYIEPSVTYNDLYLQLTREFASRFKAP